MSTGEELYLLFLTGNRCRTSHSCERRWNLCKELMSDRVSRRLVHSLCACCVFVCESQGSSDLEQNEELFNTYDDSLLGCHLSESWWADMLQSTWKTVLVTSAGYTTYIGLCHVCCLSFVLLLFCTKRMEWWTHTHTSTTIKFKKKWISLKEIMVSW